jgi:hypothetical protein
MTAVAPRPNIPPVTTEPNPVPKPTPSVWAEVIKIFAESGMALASLAFAAFTFLYASMLTIRESTPRANQLKSKLRHSLYATALTVALSATLTGCALGAMVSEKKILTVLTVALSVIVGVIISGIAIYLALDIYQEGKSKA